MKHHDKRALEERAARAGHPQKRTPEVVPVRDAVTSVMLDHLHAVHVNTAAQLDILRKTRGQREVGSVKVPAHLQVPDMVDDSGVESRGSILPILGPKE